MKEIIKKSFIGALVFSFTVIGIGLTYASLSTVSSGDTLTATMWNEVVSKTNLISDDGNGVVSFSGTLDLGIEIVSDSCFTLDCNNIIECPTGKKVIGGGCNFYGCGSDGLDYNAPNADTNNEWKCKSNSCDNNVGYAICANVN